MDLLDKLLGNKSAGHARRIRAVNVNQPERGRQMVWERLGQCYGSPEAVERAQDCQKLREQSMSRNDPSFDLTMFNTVPSNTDRPVLKHGNQRPPILVHKMEVSSPPVQTGPKGRQRSLTLSKDVAASERNLPKIEKPSLRKMGYRCCESTSNLARNCKVSVKCSECESKRPYILDLHPGS